MERLKNGPLLVAIVLAAVAGLVWFGVRSNMPKSTPQNAAPAAVTAPANTTPSGTSDQPPAQTKEEEKKAKRNDVIIG